MYIIPVQGKSVSEPGNTVFFSKMQSFEQAHLQNLRKINLYDAECSCST